jgi:uncharacterized protein YgiB involved in biofilm formation
MFDRSRGASRLAMAVAMGLTGALCGERVAQDAGGGERIFFDAEACRAAKVLSDGDCEIAFANAKAEFDEKAPRFVSRAECERYFRRCMIGDIAGGGRRVTFIPQMRGFVIETGRERQVVPVAEGAAAAELFQPRPLARADDAVNAAKTAAAQQVWKAMMASAAAATPSGEDTSAPANAGPAQTYPLPPSMLQDLRNRERAFGAPQAP